MVRDGLGMHRIPSGGRETGEVWSQRRCKAEVGMNKSLIGSDGGEV